MVFGQTQTYMCDDGHSVSAEQSDSSMRFLVTCNSDGDLEFRTFDDSSRLLDFERNNYPVVQPQMEGNKTAGTQTPQDMIRCFRKKSETARQQRNARQAYLANHADAYVFNKTDIKPVIEEQIDNITKWVKKDMEQEVGKRLADEILADVKKITNDPVSPSFVSALQRHVTRQPPVANGASQGEGPPEYREISEDIKQQAANSIAGFEDVVFYQCMKGYRVDPADASMSLENTWFALQNNGNDEWIPFARFNPQSVTECLPVQCKAYHESVDHGFKVGDSGPNYVGPNARIPVGSATFDQSSPMTYTKKYSVQCDTGYSFGRFPHMVEKTDNYLFQVYCAHDGEIRHMKGFTSADKEVSWEKDAIFKPIPKLSEEEKPYCKQIRCPIVFPSTVNYDLFVRHVKYAEGSQRGLALLQNPLSLFQQEVHENHLKEFFFGEGEKVEVCAKRGYSFDPLDNPFHPQKNCTIIECSAMATHGPLNIQPINTCAFPDIRRRCETDQMPGNKCLNHKNSNGVIQPDTNQAGTPYDDYICECKMCKDKPEHPEFEHLTDVVNGQRYHNCTQVNDHPLQNGPFKHCNGYGTITDQACTYKCDCDKGYERVFIDGTEKNQTCAPLKTLNIPADDAAAGRLLFAESDEEVTNNITFSKNPIYPSNVQGAAEIRKDRYLTFDTNEQTFTCKNGYGFQDDDGNANHPDNSGANAVVYKLSDEGVYDPPFVPVKCQKVATIGKQNLPGQETNPQLCCPKFISLDEDHFNASTISMKYVKDAPIQRFPVQFVDEYYMYLHEHHAQETKDLPFTVRDDGSWLHKCIEGHSLQINGHCDPTNPREFKTKVIDTTPVGGFADGDGARPELICNSTSCVCGPVECGLCASVKNGTSSNERLYGTDEIVVYSEQITIRCDLGHTIDELASNEETNKIFTRKCLTNGTLTRDERCLPVNCKVASAVQDTKLVTTTEVRFPNTAKYNLDKGFSLDGAPQKTDNTNAEFERKCQPNAEFAAPPVVRRVECHGETGAEHHPHTKPPTLANSPPLFEDQLTYKCDLGYTTDGKATTEQNNHYVMTCQHNGTFSHSKTKCQPVQCPVVVPGHASLQTHTPADIAYFAKDLTGKTAFQCNPGYAIAKSGDSAGNRLVQAQCQPDGKLKYIGFEQGTDTTLDYCVNVNDCKFPKPVMCNNDNDFLCKDEKCKCIDHDRPTGNRTEDYSCQCRDGFEQYWNSDIGQWDCRNINDCPVEIPEGRTGCGPAEWGTCTDDHEKVHTYICNPYEGFVSVTQTTKGTKDNATLAPMILAVPEMDHTSSFLTKPENTFYPSYATPKPTDKDIHFAVSRVNGLRRYCSEGYTTDAKGLHDTNSFFNQSVFVTAGSLKLTAMDTKCQPVDCGPTAITHGHNTPAHVTYETPISSFSCETGYSKDGKPCGTGNCQYEVTCAPSGSHQCGTCGTVALLETESYHYMHGFSRHHIKQRSFVQTSANNTWIRQVWNYIFPSQSPQPIPPSVPTPAPEPPARPCSQDSSGGNFCKNQELGEQYKQFDCDGDGKDDATCVDHQGNRAVILSSKSCQEFGPDRNIICGNEKYKKYGGWDTCTRPTMTSRTYKTATADEGKLWCSKEDKNEYEIRIETYLTGMDLDGDGKDDHVCYDQDGFFGTILSTKECQSEWAKWPAKDKYPSGWCARPKNWCSQPYEHFIYVDEDKDGHLDAHCVDMRDQSDRIGWIKSSENCKETWTGGGESSDDQEIIAHEMEDLNAGSTDCCRCTPIHCPDPPKYDHCNTTSKQSHYPLNIVYQCHKGYHVELNEGVVTKTNFEAQCQPSSEFTKPEDCKPNPCHKSGLDIPQELQGRVTLKNGHENFVYDGPTADFDCVEGYTLDNKAWAEGQNNSKFELRCKASQAFEQFPGVDRVVCGKYPYQDHMEAVNEDTQRFQDKMMIECSTGYSVKGEGKITQQHTECLSNATFKFIEPCERTMCKKAMDAIAKDPDNMNIDITKSMGSGFKADGVEYNTDVKLHCKPGYTFKTVPGESGAFSTVPELDGQSIFHTRCKLDATLEGQGSYDDLGKLLQCYNYDDCKDQPVRNQGLQKPCGKHGRCIDGAKPVSDKHRNYDNFHCACEEGYVAKHPGNESIGKTKLPRGRVEIECVNRNDCPDDACHARNLPEVAGGTMPEGTTPAGECIDKINTYSCKCNDGYYQPPAGATERDPMAVPKFSSRKHDQVCIPKSCGKPRVLDGAEIQVPTTNEIDVYYGQIVHYKCKDGWSTDKLAAGENNLHHTAECMADGMLSYPPADKLCQPIVCDAIGELHKENGHVVRERENTLGKTIATEWDIDAEPTTQDSIAIVCDEGYTFDKVPLQKPGSPQNYANSFRPVKCHYQNASISPAYWSSECQRIKCNNQQVRDDWRGMGGWGLDRTFSDGVWDNDGWRDEWLYLEKWRYGDVINTFCAQGFHFYASPRDVTPIMSMSSPNWPQWDLWWKCKSDGIFNPIGYSWNGELQEDGKTMYRNTCRKARCSIEHLNGLQHTKAREDPDQKMIYYEETTTVECETGYTLDGHANGPSSFELQCHSWTPSQSDLHIADGTDPHTVQAVEGVYSRNDLNSLNHVCKPVTCHPDPLVEASDDTAPTTYYTDETNVQCDLGYSIDAMPHTEDASNTRFTRQCKADGFKTNSDKRCQHIQCREKIMDLVKEQHIFAHVVEPEIFLANETKQLTCDHGYWMNGNEEGMPVARCTAEGKVVIDRACVRYNDCTDGDAIGNTNCKVGTGTNKCDSPEKPTSEEVPMGHDYMCTCENSKPEKTGTDTFSFKRVTEEKLQFCRDRNWCTDPAYNGNTVCAEGVDGVATCNDLSGGKPGYTCNCPEGWQQTCTDCTQPRCEKSECKLHEGQITRDVLEQNKFEVGDINIKETAKYLDTIPLHCIEGHVTGESSSEEDQTSMTCRTHSEFEQVVFQFDVPEKKQCTPAQRELQAVKNSDWETAGKVTWDIPQKIHCKEGYHFAMNDPQQRFEVGDKHAEISLIDTENEEIMFVFRSNPERLEPSMMQCTAIMCDPEPILHDMEGTCEIEGGGDFTTQTTMKCTCRAGFEAAHPLLPVLSQVNTSNHPWTQGTGVSDFTIGCGSEGQYLNENHCIPKMAKARSYNSDTEPADPNLNGIEFESDPLARYCNEGSVWHVGDNPTEQSEFDEICLADGTAAPVSPGECRPVKCDIAQAKTLIANGELEIDESKTYIYGDKLNLQCNTGYSFGEGSVDEPKRAENYLICVHHGGDRGEWEIHVEEHHDLTCQPIACCTDCDNDTKFTEGVRREEVTDEELRDSDEIKEHKYARPIPVSDNRVVFGQTVEYSCRLFESGPHRYSIDATVENQEKTVKKECNEHGEIVFKEADASKHECKVINYCDQNGKNPCWRNSPGGVKPAPFNPQEAVKPEDTCNNWDNPRGGEQLELHDEQTYLCACPEGYSEEDLAGGQICKDKDECAPAEEAICQHEIWNQEEERIDTIENRASCTNKPGGYCCACDNSTEARHGLLELKGPDTCAGGCEMSKCDLPEFPDNHLIKPSHVSGAQKALVHQVQVFQCLDSHRCIDETATVDQDCDELNRRFIFKTHCIWDNGQAKLKYYESSDLSFQIVANDTEIEGHNLKCEPMTTRIELLNTKSTIPLHPETMEPLLQTGESLLQTKRNLVAVTSVGSQVQIMEFGKPIRADCLEGYTLTESNSGPTSAVLKAVKNPEHFFKIDVEEQNTMNTNDERTYQCTPVTCTDFTQIAPLLLDGLSADVSKATYSQEPKSPSDEEPSYVMVRCPAGESFDGKASSKDDTKELHCGTNGEFALKDMKSEIGKEEDDEACERIKCPASLWDAFKSDHSNLFDNVGDEFVPDDLRTGDEIIVDCAEGHRLGGRYFGASHFTVQCGYNHNFGKLEVTTNEICEPIKCWGPGGPTDDALEMMDDSQRMKMRILADNLIHSLHDNGMTWSESNQEAFYRYAFPTQPMVKCLPGYMMPEGEELVPYNYVDGKDGDVANFHYQADEVPIGTCGAGGEFEIHPYCVPIELCDFDVCGSFKVPGGCDTIRDEHDGAIGYHCDCMEDKEKGFTYEFEDGKLRDGSRDNEFKCRSDDCAPPANDDGHPHVCGMSASFERCEDLSDEGASGEDLAWKCSCAPGFNVTDTYEPPGCNEEAAGDNEQAPCRNVAKPHCTRGTCPVHHADGLLIVPPHAKLMAYHENTALHDEFAPAVSHYPEGNLYTTDKLEFQCDEGYSFVPLDPLANTKEVFCENNGETNPPFEDFHCEKVKCEALTIPGDEHSINAASAGEADMIYAEYEDVVVFDCNEGYKFEGEVFGSTYQQEMKCDKEGNLVPVGELKNCMQIVCADYKHPMVNREMDHVKHPEYELGIAVEEKKDPIVAGASMLYTCQAGYRMEREFIISHHGSLHDEEYYQQEKYLHDMPHFNLHTQDQLISKGTCGNDGKMQFYWHSNETGQEELYKFKCVQIFCPVKNLKPEEGHFHIAWDDIMTKLQDDCSAGTGTCTIPSIDELKRKKVVPYTVAYARCNAGYEQPNPNYPTCNFDTHFIDKEQSTDTSFFPGLFNCTEMLVQWELKLRDSSLSLGFPANHRNPNWVCTMVQQDVENGVEKTERSSDGSFVFQGVTSGRFSVVCTDDKPTHERGYATSRFEVVLTTDEFQEHVESVFRYMTSDTARFVNDWGDNPSDLDLWMYYGGSLPDPVHRSIYGGRLSEHSGRDCEVRYNQYAGRTRWVFEWVQHCHTFCWTHWWLEIHWHRHCWRWWCWWWPSFHWRSRQMCHTWCYHTLQIRQEPEGPSPACGIQGNFNAELETDQTRHGWGNNGTAILFN